MVYYKAQKSWVCCFLQCECVLDSSNDDHKESQISQMKKSESNGHEMVQSFQVFLNPFDPLGSDKLVSLSSGLQATSDIDRSFGTSSAWYPAVQEIHQKNQHHSMFFLFWKDEFKKRHNKIT